MTRDFLALPLFAACLAICGIALASNASDERRQEQATLQIFETPPAELEQLTLEELIDLREDINPKTDQVAKKAAEKLDKAITSKAAD